MKKPTSPEGKTNSSKKKSSTKKPAKLIKVSIKQITPKYIIALRILVKRSLVELEALSIYGETCLHSTISYLSNERGIRFNRKREVHFHQNGGRVFFMRYKIFEQDKSKALIILKPHEGKNDDDG